MATKGEGARRQRTTLGATRESLLEAGEELVREQARDRAASIAGALGHIRSADVAARAEVSKGMIYHLWPSQEAYRRELLIRLAHSSTVESFVATESPDVLDAFDAADTAIAAVANLTLDRALGDEQWFVFMEVSSYLANEQVREAMAEGQADALANASAFFAAGLQRWGLRMRPGYRVEDLVLLTRALSRGITLQAKVSVEALFEERPWRSKGKWSLYTVGISALFDALTEPAE